MANLIDVTREFGAEKACFDYLERLRWPEGVACLECGSKKISRATSSVKNRRTGKVSKARYVYDCLICRHQFTATTGTIFHDSHLPLAKWFLAIAMITDAKKSVSALQMQRHLGVSYRTAWYLGHRIRKAMQDSTDSVFGGIVEVDETYIGGSYDKRGKRNRYEKQAVVGLVKRGTDDELSQVQAFPIKRASKAVLVGVVRDRISKGAQLVCTDELAAYKILRRHGYRHETVKHVEQEYVRGEAHTNSIENFWSLFKRGLVGSFHKVSIKHLSRYLDEFTYRFNGRGYDLFTPTLIGLVNTERMPYKELVATDSSAS